MSLVLNSLITIGAQEFDFVTEVSFSKSVDTLTNSGTITIPRNLVFKNGNEIITEVINGDDPLFQRGQAVKVELGYRPNLQTYFEGFVSDIAPTFPLRFDIEDNMFNLKNRLVKPLNFKQTTIENLLQTIIPDIEFEATGANLGNLRIEDPVSVTQVLDFLKSKYGISSYFLPTGVLNVGLAFPEAPNISSPHVFKYGTKDANIIDDSGLIYRKEDQQRLRITATSIFPDNSRIQITVGDADGEQKTIYQYNMPEAALRSYAEEQLSRLKYEGFEGSFLSFLEPKVEPGEAVQIVNNRFPEKNGVYLVRGVTTRSGVNGGRQTIELETRLS